MNDFRKIHGTCHCSNVAFDVFWPAGEPNIRVRQCGCDFCRKHGGAWTSHRGAKLTVFIEEPSLVTAYRFGTETADFIVCSRCGVVPFVLSEIGDRKYAVVNANTFEDAGGLSLSYAATDFDGEQTGQRLERRKQNWISEVDGVQSLADVRR